MLLNSALHAFLVAIISPLRYSHSMPKRQSSKADPNQMAYRGLQSLLDKLDPEAKPKEKEKGAAAVERGRSGGKKGGPARAAKLSPKERKEIARKAAILRWKKDS